MRPILRRLGFVAACGVVGATLGSAGPRAESLGPRDALTVRESGGWLTWWRRNVGLLPAMGSTPLADRVAWRAGAEGLEWGELQLSGASEAWRTRLVVARLDPHRVMLALQPAFTRDRQWSVGDLEGDAVVAFDPGQFRESLPWGWVVTGGREILPPQCAPLAGAVVIDSAGAVKLIEPDGVAAERRRGTAVEAFQSYPMLLHDGKVPAPLLKPGLGVNIEHRDARLALGTMPDGRVVVALTRFDALGHAFGRIPFGLTSAEMAAVMAALGCRQALLLDGGISGQLLLREAGGKVRRWPGTRSVPLGLIGRSRP